MSYLDLTIVDIHQALLSGKVTPLELAQEAIKRAKEDDNNAFEYIYEKEVFDFVKELDKKDRNSLLWGIPFVIKDNFCTKDIPTTASSKMLEGYVPVFSSEVYSKLINAGAIPIGKTTLDELAMGGTGTSGHKERTYNPYDKTKTRMVGGSSCGSASATANNIAPLGIGSDTGDSVRKPASYSGLVGFKPTWGRISRYGLMPFASSLDNVAYFTRSIEDSALTLELLAGRDYKDSTSADNSFEQYFSHLKPCISGVKVAIIKEIFDSIKNETIKKAFLDNVEELKRKGAVVEFVSMDIKLLRAVLPTYFIISSAEATSNNSNLDGIKFGPRIDGTDYQEIMTKTRSAGFSESIRRRFIIGSYSLLNENQYDIFLKAQKARRLIVEAVNNILKSYDFIYLPAAPSVAPYFNKQFDKLSDEYLIAENYLAIDNFAGLPSLTLPLGKIGGLPFGANITSHAFNEQMIFNFALGIQEITGLKNLSAKENS